MKKRLKFFLLLVFITGCFIASLFIIFNYYFPYVCIDVWKVIKDPRAITVDLEGNVYIRDRRRLCKYNSNGEFIWIDTPVIKKLIGCPKGIVPDSAGNLYVANLMNCCIEKYDSSGNFITTWEGKGDKAGEFFCPFGIAIDKDENILVTDCFHIQKFTPEGDFIEKLNISVPSGWKGSKFNPLNALGFLLKNQYYRHTIQLPAPEVWDGPIPYYRDGIRPTFADITIDLEGNTYVVYQFLGPAKTLYHYYCDYTEPNYTHIYSRIYKFDPSGKLIKEWEPEGSDNGFFYSYILAITTDLKGNILAYNHPGKYIYIYDSSGKYITRWSGRSFMYLFEKVSDIEVGPEGNLYITDSENNCIKIFKPNPLFELFKL